MPGKVKVRIVAGRNLPVMDRSSDNTDAYVEVKLGNTTQKTDVCRKSLHPQWNSEWFIFEVDDSELQDEPLQIRIMDYDIYSSNDAIGKVYIDLNPLLFAPTQASQGKSAQDITNSSVMSGWLPVYDTMHGIRGEVNIVVKVDLFSDFNKFRQSSCGVQFFFTAGIPTGFRCNSIIGFVEELVVNDDPEYQWIDKIRTPRASNEARQTLFSKLSGELQRRIGLKVLEQGGNAVIGYRQCFDLEGESGIVVRGIGSVVSLSRVFQDSGGNCVAISTSPHRENSTNAQRDDPPSTDLSRCGLSPCTASPKRTSRSRKTSGNLSRSPQLQEPYGESGNRANHSPTHSIKMSSPSKSAGVYINRRSSDSELSITPKGSSAGSLNGRCGDQRGFGSPRVFMSQESFEKLIYPFLTMKAFPPGFIIQIGGTVCSRAVQLLDRAHPEELGARDAWWSGLRTEIRSHARAMGCNVVIGYEEFTSITDEVCLLNAVGTAAVINVRYQELENYPTPKVSSSQKSHKEQTSTSSEKKDEQQTNCSTGAIRKDSVVQPLGVANRISQSSNPVEDSGESSGSASGGGGSNPSKQMLGGAIGGPVPKSRPSCAQCHSPKTEEITPPKKAIFKCAICRKARVAEIMLATIELPSNMPTIGQGCLIQSRVIRPKRDSKGELNAKEVSDAVPFLEYDLHKQLYHKMMIRGMNAIFSLRVRVTIGEKFIVGLATGTGVYLKALPPATPPRVVCRIPMDEARKMEMQRKINEAFDKNRQLFGLNVPVERSRVSRSVSKADSESEESDDEVPEVVPSNNENYDLDLDDYEDVEMINLLLEDHPPRHLVAVCTQIPPGIPSDQTITNLQMFTKVWRSKTSMNTSLISFSNHFDKILQSIYFKLRNLSPCMISNLTMNVDLPEDDEVQVSIFAMVLGVARTATISTSPLPQLQSPNIKMPTTETSCSEKKISSTKSEEVELMFRMEEVSLNEEKDKNVPPKALPQSSHLKSTSSTHSFPSIPSATSFSSESSSARSSFKIKNELSAFPYNTLPDLDRFGVQITPLSFIPGAKVERYLGNLNFFFIRESTSIKENGGLSGFMGSFVTEVLALARAHVSAIGGNAMISYFLSECVLLHNPHKNQGQCLVNVGGDIVFVQYNNSLKSKVDSEATEQLKGTTAISPSVFE